MTQNRHPIWSALFGLGLIAGTLYGCGMKLEGIQVETPPVAVTSTNLVTTLELATPSATATRKPSATKMPTPTIPPKVVTVVAENCPGPGLDAYLAVVLPLADQDIIDSKKGEKMAQLTQAEIEAYRQAASDRLEKLQQVTPPGCMRDVHKKMTSSFEQLSQAWEYGLKKDFENARLALIASYSDMADATAMLAGY